MTESELILRVKRDLAAQANELSDPDDYTDAVDDMERETGWSMPQTGDFQIQWSIKRTVRHLLYRLLYSSARKFKAETFHLDQRYSHYKEVIADMDKDWNQAIEDNTYLLAGASVSDMFGTLVSSGYSTNAIGEDSTYDPANLVESFPKSEN